MLTPRETLGAPLVGAACCATWPRDYVRAARLHGTADGDIRAALDVGAIN
jgi:hypothetical protein